MKLIGLTGGIATGKSTASNYIKNELKIPVIDADLIARQVVEPGRPAYNQILRYFGQDVLNEDKTLNREKLGQIIFNDKDKRLILNKCTHPYVRQQMIIDIIRYFIKGNKLVVLDVPLLFESQLDRWVNKTILIHVPRDIEIKRFLNRNPELNQQDVEKRIDSQMPLDQKSKLADYVVDNSGSKDETFIKIKNIIMSEIPSQSEYIIWFIAPLIILLFMLIIAFSMMKF